jgi:hypothetical protein
VIEASIIRAVFNHFNAVHRVCLATQQDGPAAGKERGGVVDHGAGDPWGVAYGVQGASGVYDDAGRGVFDGEGDHAAAMRTW